MLVLPSAWSANFKTERAAFDYFFAQEGEIFRHHKNRKTLRFPYAGQRYFIKTHQNIGWPEIFKNILSFKKPIISARNEWRALKKLKEIHVPTLEAVAIGERGCNPATKQSFLITQELAPHIDLAVLFKQWRGDATKIKLKRCFIEKMAHIANKMHRAGINHRDFYLCHFIVKTDQVLNENSKIYLIDLHRAQIRNRVPSRWLIKDLAGLYFSALEVNVSLRDCLRFLKIYCGKKKLKTIFTEEKHFWSAVSEKAHALHHKLYGAQKDQMTVTRKLENKKIAYRVSLESSDFLYFLSTIEEQFSKHDIQYLKKGDTTTVIRVEYNKNPWVIKRYNRVGWWGKIKRAVTTSRARRCWHYSQKLLQLGIHTPTPIAYVEQRKGPFCLESYGITEFISGQDALSYFNQNPNQQYAQKVMQEIEKMFAAHITHGDMKATNILLADNKVYFLDLDAMRQHTNEKSFQRAKQKDIRRFEKNWKTPEIKQLFIKQDGATTYNSFVE